MKYCYNCGTKIEKNASYCTHCGKEQLELVENEQGNKEEFQIASQTRRLLNYLVDITIGIYGSAYIMGFFTGALGIISGDEGDEFFTLFGLLAAFIYYFITEHLTGKTLGKLLTKTRVVMLDGSKPTPKALIIRSLTRFVPFEAFSFGGSRPRGWHDKWSGTVVIEE